jgi:hypothetical protein
MQLKFSAGEFMRMWKLSVLVGAVFSVTGCFQNLSSTTRDTDTGAISSRPSNGEGAPHGLLWTHGEEVNRAWLAFLTK